MAPTNNILMLLLMSTVVCYQLNILILLLLQRRIVREKMIRSLVKNVCKAIRDRSLFIP